MPLGNARASQAGTALTQRRANRSVFPYSGTEGPRPWCLPTLSMNTKSFLVYTVFLQEKDTAEQTLMFIHCPSCPTTFSAEI